MLGGMWRRGVLRALLLACVITEAAYGANCGGSTPCRCGDTVSTNYTMPADLGPCPGHGLFVKSSVTLDCQGGRITGTGTGTERYGIYVRGDTGAEVRSATVRRCQVTGFYHGLRLRAAEDNRILDNRFHGNGDFSAHAGYGIDVTVGSARNLIQGNVIEGNADEGIHLASGTSENDLVGNVFADNFREQIYLLESHGNRLVGNATSGTGSNSLYLKDSQDNHLEGNTFADRVARVTGDATDNVFVDNVFNRASLQFHVYDASPDRSPTGNSVIGGSMSNPSGTCLRFVNSWDNVIADVALAACSTQVASEGTAAQPSSNTVIGMDIEPGKVSADSDSTLTIAWWLSVRVQEASGAPVAGARVVIVDLLGDTLVALVTGPDGAVPPQALAEEVRVGGLVTARTPHAVTTSRTGYLGDTRVVHLSRDTAVTVTLARIGGPPPPPPPPPPGGGGGGGAGGFSDKFGRPDSASLGADWDEVAGDLDIEDGAVRTGDVKGYSVAVVPALSGATQTAAAEFVSTANDARPRFGLVLRYQDPKNYYAAYRQVSGQSSLRIVRVRNGVSTVLASMYHPKPGLNTMFRLEASVSGSRIALELDGVTMLSALDSSFSAGSAGVVLGSESAARRYRADNFTASVQ